MKLVYSPTDKMVADYNNMIQGQLFLVHMNTILRIYVEYFMLYKNIYIKVLKQYDLYQDEDDLFNIDHRSVLELHVALNVKIQSQINMGLTNVSE